PKQNPDYSRIISPREVRRLALLVDKEKVVVGGDYDEAERYFAPTTLYPVDWTDDVMQGEIFGPILPILTYSDLRDAITQIKSGPRPLAGYIFSKDQNTIDEFVSGFSFGGGAVNQTNIHVYLDSVPFGGVGESGIGSANGKHDYDSLTHAKSILISPPDVSIDHVYPPFTMDKIQALNQWLDYEHSRNRVRSKANSGESCRDVIAVDGLADAGSKSQTDSYEENVHGSE